MYYLLAGEGALLVLACGRASADPAQIDKRSKTDIYFLNIGHNDSHPFTVQYAVFKHGFFRFLCTVAFLYVRYSFLLISFSNKFCDLNLLH
jgi:hypothetical protein